MLVPTNMTDIPHVLWTVGLLTRDKTMRTAKVQYAHTQDN